MGSKSPHVILMMLSLVCAVLPAAIVGAAVLPPPAFAQSSLAQDIIDSAQQEAEIAFSAFRDHGGGNGEIYVMNADGSDQTRLTFTDLGVDNGFPSWSPDGTKIAFWSSRDGIGDIYVMNADDGSEVTRLTDDPAFDYAPTWSPDGTKIAFTSFRDQGDGEIYVTNADGSGETRLTNSLGHDDIPDWGPADTTD